jgi:CRP/FNR family transcriptional regulator
MSVNPSHAISPSCRETFQLPQRGLLACEEVRREINKIGHFRKFRAGSTIAFESEESGISGIVATGVVRVSKILVNGNQHVVGLIFRGGYFGHAFSGGSFAYEAATDVSAFCFRTAVFEGLVTRNRGIEHAFMTAMMGELNATREWMLSLTGQGTLQRVASFMLHIRDRMRVDGESQPDTFIHFPVSRRDIAAYTGTTVETISRHIQLMARKKIIRILDSAHFEVLNEAALRDLAGQADSEADEQMAGLLTADRGLGARQASLQTH